ncbi:MAG: hypothetical protein CMN60_21035 [Sphingobium sp.]|nr:hypothetical protein [Sphingobium sp.]MBS50117.1 hypothetical protein [Sphingobium sp.]
MVDDAALALALAAARFFLQVVVVQLFQALSLLPVFLLPQPPCATELDCVLGFVSVVFGFDLILDDTVCLVSVYLRLRTLYIASLDDLRLR